MALGLRRCSPARRPHPASLSVRVPALAHLLAASLSLALAGSALLFSYRYRHRFGQVPFILIVHAHAGHTSARARAVSDALVADISVWVQRELNTAREDARACALEMERAWEGGSPSLAELNASN